jgi:hypothetical protein
MQRKRAAILSADIANNYSGLVEVDEAGTLTRLEENRAVIFKAMMAEAEARLAKSEKA